MSPNEQNSPRISSHNNPIAFFWSIVEINKYENIKNYLIKENLLEEIKKNVANKFKSKIDEKVCKINK